jgi:L-asparagine transporter-like permease
MSLSIRQIHRWVSIAFTLGVIAYMVVMSFGRPPFWVGLFALVPLILLLATGLYMLARHYLGRSRS